MAAALALALAPVRDPRRTPDAPAKRPRVLYVDDSADNCVVVKANLGRDCDVTATQDVDEALDLVRAGLVDVVVTDQRMPVMTGTELAAAVARAAPGLPVIIVSAFNDVPALQDVINQRLPVKRWFCKPLDMGELLAAVRQFVAEAAEDAEDARREGAGALRVCSRVVAALDRAEAATADLVAMRVRAEKDREEGERHVPA